MSFAFYSSNYINRMHTYFRYAAKRYALAGLALFLIGQSCVQKTPEQIATLWTENIKQKVMENAGQQPDSTKVDSTHHEITFYKRGKTLKHYYLTPILDSNDGRTDRFDTGMIVYYSTNPDFQYVKQPCRSGIEESYEIVAYKGNRYGLARYAYCDKRGTETGYQFNNLNVGTWITYDSTGAILKQIDAGNTEKLRRLDSLSIDR